MAAKPGRNPQMKATGYTVRIASRSKDAQNQFTLFSRQKPPTPIRAPRTHMLTPATPYGSLRPLSTIGSDEESQGANRRKSANARETTRPTTSALNILPSDSDHPGEISPHFINARSDRSTEDSVPGPDDKIRRLNRPFQNATYLQSLYRF